MRSEHDFLSQKIKRIAIIPGSFDPMTKGHTDIVKRAAAIFDYVVVAVMVNPAKSLTQMFTYDERKRIAEASCKDIPNVKVIVSDGMLWELARNLGACAIVKGVRNTSDFEYEQEMAKFNHEHNPDAETVYLPAYDVFCNISSTAVREMLWHTDTEAVTEKLSGLIEPCAVDTVKEIFADKCRKKSIN